MKEWACLCLLCVLTDRGRVQVRLNVCCVLWLCWPDQNCSWWDCLGWASRWRCIGAPPTRICSRNRQRKSERKGCDFHMCICIKDSIPFVCVCVCYLWRLHCKVLHQKPLVVGQTHMLLPRVRHSETLEAHWLLFAGPVNIRLPLFTLT